jgi:hypothetical protein
MREYKTLHDLRINEDYPGDAIVIDELGNEHPYMLYGKRFDNWSRNIKAVKFIIK